MAKRSDRVLAVRGDHLEMLAVGTVRPGDMASQCRIRNTTTGEVSDPIPLQAVLKWGYWTDPSEGEKARRLPKTGGRWRTLRDGRDVYITGKLPIAYTITRAGVRDQVTANARYSVRSAGHMHGMTEEEAMEAISETIDEEIRGKPVAVNVPYNILPKILDEGRLQNQHESGASGGYLDPKFRAQAESNVFNVEPDAPPEDFPIYGYVHGAGASLTGMYGKVRLELKDSVKSRTTVTVDDSLAYMDKSEIAPAPLSRAHKEPGCWDGASTMDYLARGEGNVVTYFETQIHGGVTLKDVKRIVLFDHTNRRDAEGYFGSYMAGQYGRGGYLKYIEEMAKKNGIEVVYGEG